MPCVSKLWHTFNLYGPLSASALLEYPLVCHVCRSGRLDQTEARARPISPDGQCRAGYRGGLEHAWDEAICSIQQNAGRQQGGTSTADACELSITLWKKTLFLVRCPLWRLSIGLLKRRSTRASPSIDKWRLSGFPSERPGLRTDSSSP
jgi:hypothetical protein